MISDNEIGVARNRLRELPQKYEWDIVIWYGTGDRKNVSVMFGDWQYEVKSGDELITIVDALCKLGKFQWI